MFYSEHKMPKVEVQEILYEVSVKRQTLTVKRKCKGQLIEGESYVISGELIEEFILLIFNKLFMLYPSSIWLMLLNIFDFDFSLFSSSVFRFACKMD